jgi:hypothetical protein
MVAAIVGDGTRPTLASTTEEMTTFMRTLRVQTWTLTADMQIVDSATIVVPGRAVTSVKCLSSDATSRFIVASTTDGTTLTGSPTAPADIRVFRGTAMADQTILATGLGGLSAWDVSVDANGVFTLATSTEKDGDVWNGLDGDITLQRGSVTESPLPVLATIATTEDDRGVRLLSPMVSSDVPGLCWMRNGEIWGVKDPQASAQKIIDTDTIIGAGFLQAVVVRGTSGNIVMWPSGNDLAVLSINDEGLTASRIQSLVWSDVDLRPSAVMTRDGSLAIATMRIDATTSKDLPTQSEIVVHTIDQETLTSVDETRLQSSSDAIMVERGSTFVLPWSTQEVELYAVNGAYLGLIQSEESANNQQLVTLPAHLSAGPYVVRCGSSAMLIMVR